VDLSLENIAAAAEKIDPVFLNSPQFIAEGVSDELGREVLVKVETMNPIGSFKGRGTGALAETLDPSSTWVCATGGNFGQGVAYAARARGAGAYVVASAGVAPAKLERMRSLGAQVEVSADADSAARTYAGASPRSILIVDGVEPAIAEGAGTIGVELDAAGHFDTVVVQIGDGALISGVARWLKSRRPGLRVLGVCASGAPAMAESLLAGRPVSVRGEGTIAAPLEITQPVPESFARVSALVDDVVLVDDDDMRAGVELVARQLSLLVEPAGAAGVAALLRHRSAIAGERVAVLLTGAGTPPAT
jgi:threonine dehydratase